MLMACSISLMQTNSSAVWLRLDSPGPNFSEGKFSVGPYELKEVYEKKLRQRMTIFREATKCTKALVNTFVTTFGVADGMHKSIVNNEVTLDELFE